MPTYAYVCPKCKHEYDRLQKMSDRTRAKCPQCGTRGERLISGGAGLVFKGSGFYITDYKNAGKKVDAEGGGTKSESGKSESGKSESGRSESGKSESGKSESGDSRSDGSKKTPTSTKGDAS